MAGRITHYFSGTSATGTVTSVSSGSTDSRSSGSTYGSSHSSSSSATKETPLLGGGAGSGGPSLQKATLNSMVDKLGGKLFSLEWLDYSGQVSKCTARKSTTSDYRYATHFFNFYDTEKKMERSAAFDKIIKIKMEGIEYKVIT